MVTAWNETGGLDDSIGILLPPSNHVAHIVQPGLVVVGGRVVFMKSWLILADDIRIRCAARRCNGRWPAAAETATDCPFGCRRKNWNFTTSTTKSNFLGRLFIFLLFYIFRTKIVREVSAANGTDTDVAKIVPAVPRTRRRVTTSIKAGNYWPWSIATIIRTSWFVWVLPRARGFLCPFHVQRRRQFGQRRAAPERGVDFHATIRLQISRIPLQTARSFSGTGNRPHGRRIRTHFAHNLQSSLGDGQLATPRRQRRDGSTGWNGQKVLGTLPYGPGNGRLLVQRANSRTLSPGRKRHSARLHMRRLFVAFSQLAGKEAPAGHLRAQLRVRQPPPVGQRQGQVFCVRRHPPTAATGQFGVFIFGQTGRWPGTKHKDTNTSTGSNRTRRQNGQAASAWRMAVSSLSPTTSKANDRSSSFGSRTTPIQPKWSSSRRPVTCGTRTAECWPIVKSLTTRRTSTKMSSSADKDVVLLHLRFRGLVGFVRDGDNYNVITDHAGPQRRASC